MRFQLTTDGVLDSQTMIRFLLFFAALTSSPLLHAALTDVFKNADGSTKWQHVANFSSGVLIILLTLVVVVLYVTWRRARRYNLALEEIRANLEQRVRERTQKLEEEIAHHVVTANMLRASESYLQNVLNSMPLILVGLTRDGLITHWNPRAEKISGVAAADAIGQSIWSIYTDITVSPRQIDQALDSGKAITLRHSQPGSYHFDITVYPLHDYDEPGVVVLVDDVTQRVMAENMLVHHDKLASMGELATTMANDINTPLQAILFDLRSFQGILESGRLTSGCDNGPDGARLQQLLENASKNGKQVESVIRNLTQFARGRTDKPQPASIVGILEHSLYQARELLSLPDTFAFGDIHVERDFATDLPLIPCYVAELQQVFLSLFRHAYQAMAERTGAGYLPTLKLQVVRSFDALSIRLQHNGRPLSDEEQMYLFEPFEPEQAVDRHDDAGKRLSFAYFIVTEQHQGHMAVTSSPENGTTFHIQLELN